MLDSPEGFHGGLPGESLKYDTDKLRWSLLPWDAVKQVVQVFTYGAKKYTAWNWLYPGLPCSRIWDAAMRHMNAWWSGENLDKESGLPHLAHAAANILMLLVLSTIPGLDDRRFPVER